MPIELLDILKNNGLATTLVIVLLWFGWKWINRISDENAKREDRIISDAKERERRITDDAREQRQSMQDRMDLLDNEVRTDLKQLVVTTNANIQKNTEVTGRLVTELHRGQNAQT